LSTKELTFAAAHVAHRAPHEWAQFISALTAYVDARRDECIRSSLDMLQVTQGRAQASRDLRDLLATCVSDANKIETKQTQKPHQPR
jgi:histidine ammonia-lyase